MSGEGAARLAWEALAAAVAQQPTMRVSRTGRSYPASCQRVLSPRLPSRPTAVPTYRRDGTTRLLVVDVDAKGGPGSVAAAGAAADRLVAELVGVGARVVRDHSPVGGVHLYVWLAEPVSVVEMGAVVRGMRALYPPVDPSPSVNAAAGHIRPPGSPHPDGGWQVLDTPLPEAVAAVSAPAGPEVWDAIRRRYAPHASQGPGVETGPGGDGLPVLPAGRGAAGGPTGRWAEVARTGDWSGWPSPSEARQAVVWACVAAGLSFTDVVRRVETGAWPGLAGFYARYPHRHRRPALARDWRAAVAFEQRRRQRPRSHARQSHTRGLDSHTPRPHQAPGEVPAGRYAPAAYRGGQYGQVRDWVRAVEVLTPVRWRHDASVQLLLRALARAGQTTGCLTVGVGVRSLALACHLDPTTVAKLLHRLADEPDPVIELLRPAHGVDADLYQLRIPPALAPIVFRTPWRPGTTRALHPVARTLGPVAGYVLEVLRAARHPVTVLELLDRLPYREQTLRDALATLASWDLATPSPDGWTLGKTSPETVAARTGADLIHQALVDQYRAERQQWHRRLGIIPPPADQPPPTSDSWQPWRHALALVTGSLGGVEVPLADDRPPRHY